MHMCEPEPLVAMTSASGPQSLTPIGDAYSQEAEKGTAAQLLPMGAEGRAPRNAFKPFLLF